MRKSRIATPPQRIHAVRSTVLAAEYCVRRAVPARAHSANAA